MYGQIAKAAAPYVADIAANAIGNMFTAGTGIPSYGTQQADDAMRSNTDYTRGKSRDQLEYEETLRRQRAGFDQGQIQAQQAYTANMANAAANANTARNMAAQAQMALNNVYQMAGDRLNTAAANTMGAINSAGSIAAGMFR
jgi:hypothetical protein